MKGGGAVPTKGGEHVSLASGALPALTPTVELELYRQFPAEKLVLLTEEQRQLLGAAVASYMGRRKDLKIDVPLGHADALRRVFQILEVDIPSALRASLLQPNRVGKEYAAQLKAKKLEPPFRVIVESLDRVQAEVVSFATRTGAFTVRLLDGSDRHISVNPTNCSINGEPVCTPIPAAVFRGPKPGGEPPRGS